MSFYEICIIYSSINIFFYHKYNDKYSSITLIIKVLKKKKFFYKKFFYNKFKKIIIFKNLCFLPCQHHCTKDGRESSESKKFAPVKKKGKKEKKRVAASV